MKLSLNPTQSRAKRLLINAFILGFLCANAAQAMGQETNEYQTNLSKCYNYTDGYVVLDQAGWNRKVIKRDNQAIVELTPTAESPFNGTFIREEREIHLNSDKRTYTLKKYKLPSQGVAFVLGSALIATAAYCWYWYSNGNSTNN